MLTINNMPTEVQCYRVNKISPSCKMHPPTHKKKTKKTQKDVLVKTASISPPVKITTSVFTGPVRRHENKSGCYTENRTRRIKERGKKVKFDVRNYQPTTWSSVKKRSGDADTTEVWKPEIQILNKKELCKSKSSIMHTKPNRDSKLKVINNKKIKRKSKLHKKRNHHSNRQPSNLHLNHITPLDTSIISLFRKDKKELTRRHKEETPNNVCDTSFKKYCNYKGCSEEGTANRNLFCRCECPAKVSKKPLNINSVVKLKDNIICVCRKYSKKLVHTKSPNIPTVNKDQIYTISKSPQDNHERTKWKFSVHSKENKRINDKVNVSEQTGEPFFEVQVNPRNMCVLNPLAIKENIRKYGTTARKEPACICLERSTVRSGNECELGKCTKANKQMNFNCRCKKKNWECGDTTCDTLNIRNKRKSIILPWHLGKTTTKQKYSSCRKPNEPLLEVQLDVDKMCVMNPNVIESKIMNTVSVNDACASGVCRDAALKRKIPFLCKCIGKKLQSEPTECDEATCTDSALKSSKICLFFKRIFSDTENRIVRSPNKDQGGLNETGPKVCRGRICSQSENLQEKGKSKGRGGPMVDPNNINLKHLPTCNCQECKNLPKTAQLKTKVKLPTTNTTNNQQDKKNMPKSDKTPDQAGKKDKKNKKDKGETASPSKKEAKKKSKKTKPPPPKEKLLTKKVVVLGLKSFANRTKEKMKETLKKQPLEKAQTLKGAMSILSEHFLETPIYQTFSGQVKSKKELEQKLKERKKRAKKRRQQTFRSCRHTLLATLRHTPCLWVYYVCPTFYPHCLSLLAFMKNFFRLLFFLVVLACWTPCIIGFELCRAVVCCFL